MVINRHYLGTIADLLRSAINHRIAEQKFGKVGVKTDLPENPFNLGWDATVTVEIDGERLTGSLRGLAINIAERNGW